MLLELWLLVVKDFVIAYALWGHCENHIAECELAEPQLMRQPDWTDWQTSLKRNAMNRIFILELILHFNLSIASSALYSLSLDNCFATSYPGDNKVKSLKMVSELEARLNCALQRIMIDPQLCVVNDIWVHCTQSSQRQHAENGNGMRMRTKLMSKGIGLLCALFL